MPVDDAYLIRGYAWSASHCLQSIAASTDESNAVMQARHFLYFSGQDPQRHIKFAREGRPTPPPLERVTSNDITDAAARVLNALMQGERQQYRGAILSTAGSGRQRRTMTEARASTQTAGIRDPNAIGLRAPRVRFRKNYILQHQGA